MGVNPDSVEPSPVGASQPASHGEDLRAAAGGLAGEGGKPLSPTAPTMPDLSRLTHGFYHTVDSALTSLARAGVAPGRITIKKGGPGWQKNRVVQHGLHRASDGQPVEGAALTPDVFVKLHVAGEGLFYYLPTGMREGAGEGQLGDVELAALFDDSVEKAAYFIRQGGLYFDVRPEDSLGCARWIRLFGISPEDWPREKWYQLAVLLPCLHGLAGSERGLRLALKTLLDLEVHAISWQPKITRLAADQLSGLGERASQLGTDLIIGDGLEDEAAAQITLGPVSLADYDRHQSGDGQHRLQQVLHLIMPCHLDYSVQWLVGDNNRAPELGVAEVNSVLGINSHLGENWR